MINAAIIKSYQQSIWQIIIHEDHAILECNLSFTYISNTKIIENYHYNKHDAPEYLFKLYRVRDIRDHRIVPSKKWTPEYRIAEIIGYYTSSKQDIEIYDDHVKIIGLVTKT